MAATFAVPSFCPYCQIFLNVDGLDERSGYKGMLGLLWKQIVSALSLCRCTHQSLGQNTKQQAWVSGHSVSVNSNSNQGKWDSQHCFSHQWASVESSHPATAAASSSCPHGLSIEMSWSLLDWTTAASRNEPRSVDVEGDITDCNSPTPTRTAALRLMSVCKVCQLHAWPSKAGTSGQEMTSRGFSERRCLLGLQKPLISSIWIAFY